MTTILMIAFFSGLILWAMGHMVRGFIRGMREAVAAQARDAEAMAQHYNCRCVPHPDMLDAVAIALEKELRGIPVYVARPLTEAKTRTAKIVVARTRVEVMVIWDDAAAGDVHLIASFPPAMTLTAMTVAQAFGLPIEERQKGRNQNE